MCNGLCSMECPPCSKKCDNSCKHRKCTQICGRPCTRCRSLCTWSCPHLKCTKLCGEACDRSPCNEHCTKILKCGHSCIGLCGEPCPKLCRVCDKQVVAKSLTEDESLATARFVELPKCGHVFTHTVLDKLMEVEDSVKSSGQTVKHCPQCKAPILQCVRYGQLLSQTWRDRVFVKPMQKPSPFMVKNQREKYIKTVATNHASSEFIQAAFQLVQRISEKRTKQQLNFKLMKLKYIYRLLEIQTTNIKKMFGGKSTQSDVLKRTKEIADAVDFLGRRLLAEKDGYTAQETKEFTNELYRIDSLLK
uniref:Uncharacterized protein n=1 Tax=Ciona savignyi TaxID=51511 RepID=H2YV56_CIOSA